MEESWKTMYVSRELVLFTVPRDETTFLQKKYATREIFPFSDVNVFGGRTYGFRFKRKAEKKKH